MSETIRSKTIPVANRLLLKAENVQPRFDQIPSAHPIEDNLQESSNNQPVTRNDELLYTSINGRCPDINPANTESMLGCCITTFSASIVSVAVSPVVIPPCQVYSLSSIVGFICLGETCSIIRSGEECPQRVADFCYGGLVFPLIYAVARDSLNQFIRESNS
jgi:hypothetical protein